MPDGSMTVPNKGYPALRRGRLSLSNAEYFLTVCAQRPCVNLCSASLVSLALDEVHRLDQRGEWHLRCAVFMPDHIHLLVTLKNERDLSAVVRSFKGRLTPRLREIQVRWQPGFYDHRLRRAGDLLPVFLYIFLNPYRAGLCPLGKAWPSYYCHPEDWSWFEPLTKSSCPEPEWLK